MGPWVERYRGRGGERDGRGRARRRSVVSIRHPRDKHRCGTVHSSRSSHRRRGYRRGYEHRRRRVVLLHRLRHRLLLRRLLLRRLWDAAAGHGAHRARGVAVGWIPRRRALLVHLRRGGVIRRRSSRWMRLLRRLWDAAVRRLVGRARGGMGRRPGLRGGIPRRGMRGRRWGRARGGGCARARERA